MCNRLVQPLIVVSTPAIDTLRVFSYSAVLRLMGYTRQQLLRCDYCTTMKKQQHVLLLRMNKFAFILLIWIYLSGEVLLLEELQLGGKLRLAI